MPELPEVDAIAGVARKYAAGSRLHTIEVLRGNGKYLDVKKGFTASVTMAETVNDVFRMGKVVVFELLSGRYLVVHNAMTGYFDWEHEPWTFDYVEGKRKATESDVRVRMLFMTGEVLRFHDARLFGRIEMTGQLPSTPPELLNTPNGLPGVRTMSLTDFFQGLAVRTSIKVHLMDQSFIGGIGNIYSAEACHVAGIDPRRSSSSITAYEASVLHAALLWSVSNCIPQVRYDWLKVYRRASCGTCSHDVTKVKLGGRSTFFCDRCQG